MGFPRWRYHSNESAGRIVRSAEEDKALGPGWFDSPSEIKRVIEEEKPEIKKEAEVKEVKEVKEIKKAAPKAKKKAKKKSVK